MKRLLIDAALVIVVTVVVFLGLGFTPWLVAAALTVGLVAITVAESRPHRGT